MSFPKWIVYFISLWLSMSAYSVVALSGPSKCWNVAPRGGLTLLWHAPIASANGFGNEAIEYVSSIHRFLTERNSGQRRVHNMSQVTRVCWVQHGDLPVHLSDAFFSEDAATLSALNVVSGAQITSPVVSVCHSTPPAWSHHMKPAFDPFQPCPFVPSLLVVARSMFESGTVPEDWIPRLLSMKEVWLPTPFHMATFSNASSALQQRLHLIPESIRTKLWTKPLRSPLPKRLLDYFFDGRSSSKLLRHLDDANALPRSWREAYEAEQEEGHDGYGDEGSELSQSMLITPQKELWQAYNAQCKTIFVSVFKWERRKGIDLLLQAFLEEFAAHDKACLVLKAPEPQQPDSALPLGSQHEIVRDAIREYACPSWAVESVMFGQYCAATFPEPGAMPGIRLLDIVLPMDVMPYLYASASAVVAPSRGEGWGRPVMEAMALGIPVIATNWSGTATLISPMDAAKPCALPLNYTLQVDAKGHTWAEPSVNHLRQRLRWVQLHPSEASAIGSAAREKIQKLYAAETIAEAIVHRIETLVTKVVKF